MAPFVLLGGCATSSPSQPRADADASDDDGARIVVVERPAGAEDEDAEPGDVANAPASTATTAPAPPASAATTATRPATAAPATTPPPAPDVCTNPEGDLSGSPDDGQCFPPDICPAGDFSGHGADDSCGTPPVLPATPPPIPTAPRCRDLGKYLGRDVGGYGGLPWEHDLIREMQRRLIDLGYGDHVVASGGADGQFGEGTVVALQQWASDYGWDAAEPHLYMAGTTGHDWIAGTRATLLPLLGVNCRP